MSGSTLGVSSRLYEKLRRHLALDTLQRRLLPPQHPEVKRARRLRQRVLPRMFTGGSCHTLDPLDMDSHGLGPPVAEAPRQQVTVDRIASFVASSVGARAA